MLFFYLNARACHQTSEWFARRRRLVRNRRAAVLRIATVLNRSVEDVLLLSRCLAVDGPADLAVPAGTGERWAAVIELAGSLFLAPALWTALERKGLSERLPADARDFLMDAQRLNGLRNDRIRDQALELVRALNGAGIAPLLLKGGAFLFDGDRRAARERMMVDLDFLVPDGAFQESVAVAEGLDYRVVYEHQDWTHDYHPLGRPGDAASVEIHRDVGEQRSLIPADEAFRRAVPLSAEGLDLYALSPTDRVLHNVFHSQIQDRQHALDRLPLRQLHDLTLICGRPGDAVSWPEIRAAMEREGYGHALACYLDLANRLLGVPRPPGFAPSWRTGFHYRRCLAQLRYAGLRRLVGFWGTLSHPFGRARIEYIYGSPGNPLMLAVNRARRVGALARRYRGRVFVRAKEVHRDGYSQ